MASGGRSAEDEGLFCEDWTGREELQLLDTVDEFGYGNWSSVSEKMGRPAEECRGHYNRVYLDQPHPQLPVLHPLATPQPSQSELISSVNNRGEDPVPPYYWGVEIGCYMPHRGDFAVEPLNSAEWLISDLECDADNEDGDDLMTALKLAAVRIYWAKVKERAFRKWVVREYGLIDLRKQMATDKIRLTRNQLAIKRLLRPFMRFMPPQTAFTLLQSLYLEEELKEDMRQLKTYRENGITTRQGAELCEELRRRRRHQRQQHGDALKNACTPEESLFSQLVLRKPEEKATVREKAVGSQDISWLSGVERLSAEERELCQTCRLHPEALLGYMAQLEGEGQRYGQLRLADARRLLKIDVNKTRKIFNYLVSHGRISCQ